MYVASDIFFIHEHTRQASKTSRFTRRTAEMELQKIPV